MPFAMGARIQSAAVQGTVYVGKGFAGSVRDNSYIVMAYNTHSNWRQLLP